MGDQEELWARPSPVALGSTLRTTDLHPARGLGPTDRDSALGLFICFRDISWPSQAPHPNHADFLTRTLESEVGLEGLLTARAGALNSGRKKRGPSVTGIGRKGLSETWAEERSILGTYLRVSLEPALKPQQEATLITITPLHNPTVLPDLTSQPICQAWLQVTLGCSKNKTPSKS